MERPEFCKNIKCPYFVTKNECRIAKKATKLRFTATRKNKAVQIVGVKALANHRIAIEECAQS